MQQLRKITFGFVKTFLIEDAYLSHQLLPEGKTASRPQHKPKSTAENDDTFTQIWHKQHNHRPSKSAARFRSIQPGKRNPSTNHVDISLHTPGEDGDDDWIDGDFVAHRKNCDLN